MYESNSAMHLRLARGCADAQAVMDEYMRAIEEAVRELKAIPAVRLVRRR